MGVPPQAGVQGVDSRMSAFPKADVQNVRIGIEPNVRLWPKADIEHRRKIALLR